MSVVVVTGGSRGFGRSTAVKLASSAALVPKGSLMVLVGRNVEMLEETCQLVRQAVSEQQLTLATVVGDLGDISHLDSLIDEILKTVDITGRTRAILVNNAGTLGDLSLTVAQHSGKAAETAHYFNLNLTSVFCLTSRFLQHTATMSTRHIINISSLLAVKPFAGWSLYASGKAARDMLHSVIASEEPSDSVRLLNYAPGPLDTEMQKSVRETIGDADQRKAFTSMHTEGTLVSPNDSASVLVTLLESNNFESGEHKDYYDLI